jgi:para-aminobenzoate synthetase component 1
VRVVELAGLESYAAVHHLVAEVVARPRADVDAVDVLAALFPGGSITGAPKLRAMEVIAELEGEGRGFFTGSLGLLDVRGRAAFNILIRTLLWRPLPDADGAAGASEVSFRVGGGVTWASDPAREDAETLDKARALAAALAAPPAPPTSGARGAFERGKSGPEAPPAVLRDPSPGSAAGLG